MTHSELVSRVKRLLRGSYDHESIAEEILLRCQSNGVDTPSNRFIYNHCIDAIRKSNTERRHLQRYSQQVAQTEELQTLIETQELIQLATEALTPRERVIIFRRFYEDESYETIAANMGISTAVVRLLLKFAIEKMTLRLTKDNND